jgi:hypothetical protein
LLTVVISPALAAPVGGDAGGSLTLLIQVNGGSDRGGRPLFVVICGGERGAGGPVRAPLFAVALRCDLR